MAAPSRVWTRDEVLALQDEAPPGVRYELIDGELLVSPSPGQPHQFVLAPLLARLYAYCRATSVGRVLPSPADLSLDDESIVQPDLFVIPGLASPAPRGWESVKRLLLAVEIVSPTSGRADRWTKRRFYQRHRVPEYWIVDTDARLIERWRPDDERPEILADTIAWQPTAELEPLSIDLHELFAESLGELHEDWPGG
jgi:Uma2 family endonuclease